MATITATIKDNKVDIQFRGVSNSDIMVTSEALQDFAIESELSFGVSKSKIIAILKADLEDRIDKINGLDIEALIEKAKKSQTQQ